MVVKLDLGTMRLAPDSAAQLQVLSFYGQGCRIYTIKGKLGLGLACHTGIITESINIYRLLQAKAPQITLITRSKSMNR